MTARRLLAWVLFVWTWCMFLVAAAASILTLEWGWAVASALWALNVWVADRSLERLGMVE